MALTILHRSSLLASSAIVAALLLAGCGPTSSASTDTSSATGGAATDGPTDQATTPDAQEGSREDPTDGSTHELKIPASAFGQGITVRYPSSWKDTEQDGVYMVVSDQRYGEPPVAASLVVSEVPSLRGMAISEAIPKILPGAQQLDQWTTTQPEGQRVTIDGLDAFQLSGTYVAKGATIATSLTWVALATGSGTRLINIAAATGVGDVPSQNVVQGILDSIVVG